MLDETAAEGLRLRALTRREQEPRAGVEWVRGDLADSGALAELVRGAEAVLHIAGVVNPPLREEFVEGNVRGTERLVEATLKAGVKRFVLVSSIAAREPGLSEYCHTKREGERIVTASGLDWTIVRPPAVFGPRDTEFLALFKLAQWGVVPMPAVGRSSMIHVADLARLLLAVLPGGMGITGQVFEPDDGRAGGWDHSVLARAIGAAVGRNVWVPRVPASLLLTIARIARRVQGARTKLTPDRARYMVHPDWISDPSRRVPEALWRPRIATADGLKETAAWYSNKGWL